MDRATVDMVKELLGELVEPRKKEGWKLLYPKLGGQELAEENFCRSYCLRNTPEVRQAIAEFLA